MMQIVKKITLYVFLILVSLELIVRSFHLHNERPVRFLDDKNVEKWEPNQSGFSVTGNRKQNVGKYRINSFGFNSVHENYEPSKDSNEIALVGDSFIEGFHEDYTNSLGQQIERGLPQTTVLNFGYSGYNLADQCHLIHAYTDLFKDIDHTFIYFRFSDDLNSDDYKPSSRLDLDTPLNRLAKEIKLVVYLKDIGALQPLMQIPGRLQSFISTAIVNVKSKRREEKVQEEKITLDKIRLNNFKKLMGTYPLAKEKFTFLLDRSTCSEQFLAYLETNNFKTLDLHVAHRDSKNPTTLIYDQHWSKHGRNLVADLILKYLEQNRIIK